MNQPINKEMALHILRPFNINTAASALRYIQKANKTVDVENEERIKNGLEPIRTTPGVTTTERFVTVKPELTIEYINKKIKEFEKMKNEPSAN